MRRTRLLLPAYAVALALLGTACGGGAEPQPSPPATGSGSPRTTPADGSSSASPSDEPPATDPVPVEAGTDLLDWQPIDGPLDLDVTMSGPWRLVVAADGASATLSGGPSRRTIRAGAGRRISEAAVRAGHALVVAQDTRETSPSVATVVDLATGEATTLVHGDSTVPTTSGGTWALAADAAYYATVGAPGRPRAYCLGEVDLATQAGRVVWCADQGQGFSNARVGADGTLSLLTFDDARPSCRTVVTVGEDSVTPYDGVEECLGWEGVTLDGGRVWSVVPRADRVEAAHVYAATDDGLLDLGGATSGSLLACGAAAYFARDAGGGDPARVLRWSPDSGLDVVYQAPRGPKAGQDGFIVAPLRCGDDRLTLTALTPAGDEQVTAGLG